ncbi:GAF domain-containing protein [Neorhizobium sp. JUb45]|uniref:sensor histidine kinase n=1 Tax=unclassified Neorhizobium TaxID=2629175 RepID=UPI001044B74D|nr:GAF domain-containing protein [Neorhizobium sp. JUb45]TCQ96767.1 two-component sensor histidine kinase [Neorhizobium sp. JUb45]
MTVMNIPSIQSELIIAERDILARVALGGPIKDVLSDIILLVEKPANGELLASVLLLSEDGKSLLEGAAPSLPSEYNAAIDGIPVGHGIGSCGTAAFSGEAVMVSDIDTDPLWADFRELALGHGLRACWSMPIKAADGRILGTFANYYHEPKEPTERDIEVIGMVTRTIAIAIERYNYEQARERAEEQRVLLLRELNHRVKNVFALTNSLLKMSARTVSTATELAAIVTSRLTALSKAHDLVQPVFSLESVEPPSDVSLHRVITDILAPYVEDEDKQRLALVGGDDVFVSSNNITAIALVLHELATNAAKYGSLSTLEGRLVVSCVRSDKIEIVWSERGGPTVSEPSVSGFGSTLVTRSVQGLRGEITYSWSSEGLDVVIGLPLSALEGPPDKSGTSADQPST